jgi:starch phosphorylase
MANTTKPEELADARRRMASEHLHVEDDRSSMRPEVVKRAFLDHLLYTQAKDEHTAHRRDLYLALANVVRDRLARRWIETQQTYYKVDAKRVYYLSLEFLMGRALTNNLINIGLYQHAKKMLAEVGVDLTELAEMEPDAGLGNGGLGRLAACFLDSMATLGIPGYGYGIRYEFGIFDQIIRNGQQVEKPEQWLKYGNPWEFARPEYLVPVKFYGRCVGRTDAHGNYRVDWVDTQDVVGMPYDTPVAGYRNDTVNTLRLWRARATNEFDLGVFNAGDYLRAVQQKDISENISKVLYPNDALAEGRELRLKQQYFFVSCSIQDIVRRYRSAHEDFSQFSDKVAIQLNDTHPSIAIPELMRLLLDVHGLGWTQAWDITQKTFSYTNHTLLSEALETWPVSLLERLLPRHMQIIYEINQRFLDSLNGTALGSDEHKQRMSIIAEGSEKRVRMAYLATVGSHTVNGVAALHTELVKSDLLPDFNQLWPNKIVNRTNGVTPRRWLLEANPRLAELITSVIGDKWPTDLGQLKKLEKVADEATFRAKFREIKRANKVDLAKRIKHETGIEVEVDSLFDVQVKRMHEYKRQLLNLMHVVALYQRIKKNPKAPQVPRTVLIGGKSAPGYVMAKLIIRLINNVAEVVNHDPDTKGKLRVAFLPNYRVSFAEQIFPASDLSEQISTAGKEASGTGNMKFSLNGALTIGTLDGANIEIREEVGAENFFLFGLTAQQVSEMRRNGYDPQSYYRDNAELRSVLDAIGGGAFSGGDGSVFQPILNNLLHRGDEYMLLADFASYLDAQRRAEETYRDPEGWSRMAILNVARMAKFNSDRAIREYAEGIWHAKPVVVELK